MPPRGLLVEEEDPRIYAPVRPTVLEQQIRDGLLRAGQPFRKDAEASYRSKLSKKARTGDQFEALRMGLMGAQDFLGGAAQAVGSPITSALSTAMPVAEGAWGAVKDTAPGREIERRATGILGAWDTATDAISDATGYPKDYASEAMLTGLMAATPAMARGAGKIADGAEDLARRYGYTFRRDPAMRMSGAGPVPKPAKASKSAEVFPELSKRYPETAPPVEVFDEAKGKTFLAKAMSGEAERFKRSRDLIVRDMEKNGYTPMFDPAKRYDADASLYAPHQSTVGQRMKKADTVAKYEAMARSPEAVDRWMRAYDTGMQFADDAGNWYHMGQLQDAFIKELGPVEGARAFKERFADGMAATTGGADPTANLLMTHYGNQLKTSGAKWPEGAYEMPYPIGGRFATGNMEQHRKMLGAGGAGVTPDNPKRYNFSGNFLGNRGAATIDEQGMGLFDPKLTVPPPGSYGHWQGSVDDMASSRGVEPRWFQEVAWAGKKYTDTGGKFRPRPMISYVNEMIERTRRLTGETADQVLRRFIRGEGAMYGVAPAGLLALPQEDDPRQQ